MSKLQANERSLLIKLYNEKGKPYAFSNPNVLWQKARKTNPSITLKKVKYFFTTQVTPSVFAKKVKKHKRSQFLVSQKDITWGTDLADLGAYKKKNNNYRYILVVVGLYTKMVMALYPQKSKTSKETAENFEKLFSKGVQPKQLISDQGKTRHTTNKTLYIYRWKILWCLPRHISQIRDQTLYNK